MNPTGTTYLSGNANYRWQDGDSYLIPQTDTIEGASPPTDTGLATASFNGLGVANQPHQSLLNKLTNIRIHQLQDEDAIATLFSQLISITSNVQQGWLRIGTRDVALGTINLLWQWGRIDITPWGLQAPIPGPGGNTGVGAYGSGTLPNAGLTLTFPVPFTSAVWMIQPYWQTNTTDSMFRTQNYEISVYDLWAKRPFGLTQNTIITGIDDDTTSVIYSPYVTHLEQINPNYIAYNGLVGIGWVALGL